MVEYPPYIKFETEVGGYTKGSKYVCYTCMCCYVLRAQEQVLVPVPMCVSVACLTYTDACIRSRQNGRPPQAASAQVDNAPQTKELEPHDGDAEESSEDGEEDEDTASERPAPTEPPATMQHSSPPAAVQVQAAAETPGKVPAKGAETPAKPAATAEEAVSPTSALGDAPAKTLKRKKKK
jgi:hypothetical protein